MGFCTLSVVVSNVCSLEDIGVGTKNLGLVPLEGLMDGTEGDWNKFVEFPPPLLKVSTYLPKSSKKKCHLSLIIKKNRLIIVQRARDSL